MAQIYEVVKQAKEKAIHFCKPGVTIADVDKTARDVIDQAGFSKEFNHSLGHGIGLNVHEAPSVSQNAAKDDTLKEGMVINSLHSHLSWLPHIISYFLYLLIVLVLTWLSMKLIIFLDTDTMEKGSISVIEPAAKDGFGVIFFLIIKSAASSLEEYFSKYFSINASPPSII